MKLKAQTCLVIAALVLLAFAIGFPHSMQQASAAPPSAEELANAVVRLPSHGASATIIATEQGRSLLLGCGHAFRGSDRRKAIVVDVPNPQAGAPKKVGVRLLDVDYEADLSLVELSDGPLPFVAPVAPAGQPLARRLLSVGYDEMKWPSTRRAADLLFSQGDTTWTRQMPWHGRSGGALLDTDSGYLMGVVSGYETTGQRRGIYVSHDAILRFLARRDRGVQGGGRAPIQPPLAPSPGIGYRLSAPSPFCLPGGT